MLPVKVGTAIALGPAKRGGVMKVAQRVVGVATIAMLAGCASNGGLGNVLGGILGTQPAQVGATVQSVDTRSQLISLTESNGQALGVSYDSRTKVVYQNQLYPVTSLEYGDQVLAHLIDNGNNGYYTDSIYVTQPVNGSATSTIGTSPANVQSLQGTVQQIDRNNGSFVIDAGGGAQLVVALPYRANSADVNRFNSLRVGDYVRFGGVYLNNNRVELRQFY
jgi:hypothetical protein